MTTLAQDKALAHVFTIYHEDTWENLMLPKTKAHVSKRDMLCDFYNGYNYEYLKKILTDLEEEFQNIWNEGVKYGRDCSAGYYIKEDYESS